MSAVRAEMKRDGPASTASCQTQTTTQHRATLHRQSPKSQDSPSMQLPVCLKYKYKSVQFKKNQQNVEKNDCD